MRGRWTRLVAILGVTAMVVSQNGSMLVNADEMPTDSVTVGLEEDTTELKSTEEETTEVKSTKEEETTEDATTKEETTEEVTTKEETTEEVTTKEETTEDATTKEETTEEATTDEYGIALLADDVIDEYNR